MIPKEQFIDHPLYGRRILHFMSPVRWSGSRYEHFKCSNYKVLNKTVEWLPMCHHYILVPHNNTIPDDRDNVTLIPFDYAQSVILNRAHFNAKELIKSFNWRAMDIDFIFNHQPELTYSLMNAIQSGRYGAHCKVFNFFHWVDTPSTKPTDVFPDGFISHLEAIHLANITFFHCEESLKYLEKNWKNENVFTSMNISHIKNKIRYMPLGVYHEETKPEPFPLPKDKKILVFNHRWAVTTGIKKLVEYTKELTDEYLIWITDDNARHPRAGFPAPKHFHVEALDYPKYLYLLEQCYATVCFVDGYMTWNLSVQDAIHFNKPSLVYDHPTQRHVLGNDYPLFFKSKYEFQTLITNLKYDNVDKFEWNLLGHDDYFRFHLHQSMSDTLENTRIPKSKYNLEWYRHIINLQNNAYKVHLLKNSHPDLYSSNVWEGLRLNAMSVGICDDPTSKFTRLFIPNDDIKRKLLKEVSNIKFDETVIDVEFENKELQNDIKESIKKKINKEKVNNSKAIQFFNLEE